MKSSFSWKEYQRLELLIPEKPTLKQRWQQFWKAFVAEWQGSTEPHLWQSRDRSGRLAWNGYDPISGRSVRGLSESDMLIWLEQRHSCDRDFNQPTLLRIRRG